MRPGIITRSGGAAPAGLLVGVVLSLTVVLAGSGCDSGAVTTTSQASGSTAPASTTSITASVDTTTVSTAPSGPALTMEQVLNATCSVLFEGELLTFTLVEGSYQVGQGGGLDDGSPNGALRGSPGGGQGQGGGQGGGASPQADRLKVIMLEPVALDDLNGDGAGDAAIALRISRGKDKEVDEDQSTGNKGASHYVVALLSVGGEPAQGGYHAVGAGARIDDLVISDGKVLLDATTPPQEGSAGGPRTAVRATLELPAENTGLLQLTNQSSETPAGDVREIIITSPESGAAVSYPLTITGRITIAPFENNLEYRAYDSTMAERATGPVTVEAADLGGPGTFSLDLSGPGPTGSVLVSISDISAADGSVLALASVRLLIP